MTTLPKFMGGELTLSGWRPKDNTRQRRPLRPRWCGRGDGGDGGDGCGGGGLENRRWRRWRHCQVGRARAGRREGAVVEARVAWSMVARSEAVMVTGVALVMGRDCGDGCGQRRTSRRRRRPRPCARGRHDTWKAVLATHERSDRETSGRAAATTPADACGQRRVRSRTRKLPILPDRECRRS